MLFQSLFGNLLLRNALQSKHFVARLRFYEVNVAKLSLSQRFEQQQVLQFHGRRIEFLVLSVRHSSFMRALILFNHVVHVASNYFLKLFDCDLREHAVCIYNDILVEALLNMKAK